MLATLRDSTSPWDLLVIGGGASGLGTALDASSRGYRTLLLEQGDFAQGTSSRSTKLIHGGVRYLKQGQLSLVREGLQERALLLQNAPHLVHAKPFILPVCSYAALFYYLAGLKLYDLLAGKLSLGASHRLTRAEVLKQIPTINPHRLVGGICYLDGQFDDARLAVNLAQTIAEQGGTVVNYMPVQKLLKVNNQIVGVVASDLERNMEYEISAKVVVNATGAFVDAIRHMDDNQVAPCIVPSQGTHIVLDRSFFPGDRAMIIPNTRDGRLLFIIPWHQRVLVGTTDVPIASASLEPRPTAQEIEYLLEYAGQYLDKRPKTSDICSAFAGIRPLVRPQGHLESSSKLSRDYVVMVSESQLVTVTGGKWTIYRKMGEDVVNQAIQVAKLPPRPCTTRSLRIHGWSDLFDDSEWRFYGSDKPLVEQLGVGDPQLQQRLHPDLPCRGIDVVWAVRHEMARRIEDVLSRRNRSLLLGARASSEIAPLVAALMAKEMGNNSEWEKQQVSDYQQLASSYIC